MSRDGMPEVMVDEPTVPAGGTVRGRVVVHSMDSIKARGVDLEVGWRTSGRGDTDEKLVHTERIHEQSVPPGGLDIPFSADLPPVPCTYHGELIKIHWFARARIDRALARDPRAEADFVVR